MRPSEFSIRLNCRACVDASCIGLYQKFSPEDIRLQSFWFFFWSPMLPQARSLSPAQKRSGLDLENLPKSEKFWVLDYRKSWMFSGKSANLHLSPKKVYKGICEFQLNFQRAHSEIITSGKNTIATRIQTKLIGPI